MNGRVSGIFAVALLGLAACRGEEELSPELAAGRDLFTTHCAMCHGEGAQGDGPMAASLPVAPPSILEHLGHHTGSQLMGLIQGGVPPAMPPAPLDEHEVQLVIDYVWTLVPEDQAVALRAMRDQMEAAEAGSMPPMPGMGDGGSAGHMMPMPPMGGSSGR